MFASIRRIIIPIYIAVFLFAGTAWAQTAPTLGSPTSYGQQPLYRAPGSFYLKAQLGVNFYGGDRDGNPDGAFVGEEGAYLNNVGLPSLGLEAGYLFSERFTLGLMHVSSDYVRVSTDHTIDPTTSSSWRHHLSVLGRTDFMPRKRISPYAQLGFNLSFGKINGDINTGFGPMGGLGVDMVVADRVNLFLETDLILTFSDSALDVVESQASSGGGFDAFGFVGFGVRYALPSRVKSANKKVASNVTAACEGPASLITGMDGLFRATFQQGSVKDEELDWDFADGATASGPSVSHAFITPGTYPVTVSHQGSLLATCQVEVATGPPSFSLEVPTTATTCSLQEPLIFGANLEASGRVVYYRWAFGDGSTSNRTNPRHTYSKPGTYTVSLTLSNTAGSTTESSVITVSPCGGVACSEVNFLNMAFFEAESSVLTRQARTALEANLEILQNCSSVCVAVEGFASSEERNSQQLAEDRVQSVATFYQEGGIDISRIMMASQGGQEKTDEGGSTQFHSVNSSQKACQ